MIEYKKIQKGNVIVRNSDQKEFRVDGMVNFNAHLYITDEYGDTIRIGPEEFHNYSMA